MVMRRTPWEGCGAADGPGPERHGAQELWPRDRGRGEATGRRWVAWRSPWRPGAGAHHDEQAWAAVRTRLTGAKGGAPAIGRMALPCRGWGRWRGGVPRQRELAGVQAGTREGTPPPLVAALGDALGPAVRQAAADTRLRWEGHGGPPRGLSVLIAPADRASRDGEQAGVGQREALDLPAPGGQDRLRAVDGGVAGDAPPRGPDRLGPGPVRPFLMPQGPTPPAPARRAGLDGDQGGRAGGPPRAPVGGNAPSRDSAVHGGRVRQGAGPGGQDTQATAQPADIRRVRGPLEERRGRRAAPDVGAVVWRAPDALPALVGHGEDPVHGGDRQAGLPARFEPGVGVEAMPSRAAAGAAGGGDIGLMPPRLARPPGSASGLGPSVDPIVQGATMAGQPALAEPCALVWAIAPADVGPLWPRRAPTRSALGPAGVEGGVHAVQGRGRQRGVSGRGTRALVAQEFLKTPP